MISQKPQASRKPLLWLVLGLTAALLVSLSIFFFLFLPKVVRILVMGEARKHGVTLDPGDIGFGVGWVQLDHPKLTLDGVRSIAIDVDQIDIALSGFSPQSIALSKVDLVVTGSLSNVALELSDWARSHSDVFSLPFSAKSADAHFLERAGDKPWLEVTGGTLERSATGGTFTAERATLAGVSLGKVGAGFSQTSSALTLGFGETDPARARVRIDVSPKATPPNARITLAPTPAQELERAFGTSFGVTGVSASGSVELAFPAGADEGSVSGKAHAALDGYVPPHPLELDGFIFGNTTSFDTDFALPKTRDRVVLANSVLQAGAFVLRGGGLVTRGSDHSDLSLELHGNLPCNALAGAAAQSRLSKILGNALGARAGEVAQKLVTGSVAVGLKVQADSRNLGAAHMDRQIGVGCGLRPLSLSELARLVPLPSDLADLVSTLPALPGLPGLPSTLPSGLPALPSGFPPPVLPTTLPPLPSLVFPLPPAPSSKPPSKSPSSKPSGATGSGG